MGQTLVEKMLPTLEKMDWPETREATALGLQAYEVGLDKADEYSNDPKSLAAALRAFQSGDSRPYAFAGVAYTLLQASREADGSYSQDGLGAALDWLEAAQDLAPDQVEINMIEAFIYVYSGRFDDARLILDYLGHVEPYNYHLLTAEIAYWEKQGNLEKAVQWYQQAMNAADTVPRKLRLRTGLGDCYLAHRQDDKALEVYKEAVHFARENPLLWHKMSLAYWRKEDFEEAQRCNKRALALRPDFPEALKLEAAIKEKLDKGGLTQRLFGR